MSEKTRERIKHVAWCVLLIGLAVLAFVIAWKLRNVGGMDL